MKEKIFYTSITKNWVDDEGIAHVVFLPGAVITKNSAKEHFEACIKYGGEKARLVLSDARSIKSSDHEGRKYFAGENFAKYTKASAVIVGSYLSKMLVSFFTSVSKPQYPVKFFTSEDEALKWLKRFL